MTKRDRLASYVNNLSLLYVIYDRSINDTTRTSALPPPSRRGHHRHQRLPEHTRRQEQDIHKKNIIQPTAIALLTDAHNNGCTLHTAPHRYATV